MTDPYVRHLCKIVVAQICKQMGFQSIQSSACEALVDVMIKYVEEVGTRSHEYAELASRTDCNFVDVRQSLADLGLRIPELINFVNNADEIQFPIAVPDFPAKPTESQTITKSDKQEFNKPEPTPPYSFDYLPPLPDPHTWKQSPAYSVKKITTASDARMLRKAKVRDRRHAQDSLAKLNDRIGAKPIYNYEAVRNTSRNPYLLPPELPKEPLNQTSALPQTPQIQPQTPFTPGMTPATPGGLFPSEPDESSASMLTPTPLRKDSSYYRAVLQNKPFENEDEERRTFSSEEESERLRKKQRAEQILAIKMDNSTTDHVDQ